MVAMTGDTLEELVGVGLGLGLTWGVAAVLLLLGAWKERQARSHGRRVAQQLAAAELAIRGIRRRAVHELLAAERDCRRRAPVDVIEGTAVELDGPWTG
jgi:hypothetical protein